MLSACDSLEKPEHLSAKIRYNQKEQPATVIQTDKDKLKIIFDEPQKSRYKGSGSGCIRRRHGYRRRNYFITSVQIGSLNMIKIRNLKKQDISSAEYICLITAAKEIKDTPKKALRTLYI